jgi:hypothetical protein
MAQKIGGKRVLDWTGAGFDVYEVAGQFSIPARHVAANDSKQLENLGN